MKMMRSVIIMACAWTLFTAAAGAETALRLDVDAETDFHDNRILRPGFDDGLTRILLSPQATAQLSQEQYTLTGRAKAVSVTSFDDRIEDDRVDILAGLDLEYRLEPGTLDLSADFDRRSVLDTQVDDTGVVAADARRTNFGAAAAWMQRLSGRTQLTFDAGISRSRLTTRQLQSFWAYSAGVGASYAASDTATLGLSFRAARQAPDDIAGETPGLVITGADTTTLSLTPTVQFQLSEFTTLNASAGPVYVDNETRDNVDWVADVAVDYKRGPWKADIGASRSFIPSANGTSRDTYLVSGTVSNRITESLTLRSRSVYRDSEIFAVTGGKARVFTISADARYRIAERAFVSGEYQYRSQRTDAFETRANGNRVMVRFTYAIETGRIR